MALFSGGLSSAGGASIASSKLNDRVIAWAKNFRGLLPPRTLMSNPPTSVFKAKSSPSAITADTGGSCSHPWETWIANNTVTMTHTPVSDDGAGLGLPLAITTSSSTKTAAFPYGMRFITDATDFELVMGYSQNGSVLVFIDDEVAFVNQPFVFPVSSGATYSRITFASNVQTIELVSASAAAGGSGYAFGDIVTLAGGTGTAATCVVSQVSSGAVSGLRVVTGGSYSVAPSTPIAQASTTGSGTGLTVTPIWAAQQTTKKLRKIEIQIDIGTLKLQGLNFPAGALVRASPTPEHIPKILFVGDSQTAGTYHTLYANGSRWCDQVAYALGMGQNFMINAQGGTGWNIDNGSALRWSDSRRLADIAALSPDIVVITGSQNGLQNATTQGVITQSLNTLTALLPKTAFVGIGPVIGSIPEYTRDGWLGADNQSRIRYIDNVSEGWLAGTGNVANPVGDGPRDFYLSSDNAHLSGAGHSYFANLAAPRIVAALLDMAI